MNCTKSDFLNIYMKSSVKDLQAKVNEGMGRQSTYTPNIDFLNKIWDDYNASQCAAFDANLKEVSSLLPRLKENTFNYQLQLEKYDFLDRLKFECGCSKYSQNVKTKKIIKQVEFDTSSIPASGGIRVFTIKGDKNAVFSMYITNEDSPKKYYNFETKSFTTTRYVLEDVVIADYSTDIRVYFPRVTDDDHYDVTILANPEFDTEHANHNEVRFGDTDRTVDVNSSTGSTSMALRKKLYQYTNNTITISAISPNLSSIFTSAVTTTDTFEARKRGGNFKFPFTVVLTAAATKAYWIKKQPTIKETGSFVERTIGSAALPISGEDISGSTYYRWPIDNALGLSNGMKLSGTNVTANSIISDYLDTTTIETEAHSLADQPTPSSTRMKTEGYVKSLEQITPALTGDSKSISKYGNETIIGSRRSLVKRRKIKTTYNNVLVSGIEFTADPVYTDGVVTSRAGNIVLNKKQADALKDDTVKIIAFGPSQVEGLTGYSYKLSNVKAELTKPTTTTTAASTGTTIAVADREGVINNISRISGIGIDASVKNPLITAGGGTDGAGNWTVDSNQPLESGITLTVENTGRVITITGDIEFTKIGESDVTIYFNIEQFLGAS